MRSLLWQPSLTLSTTAVRHIHVTLDGALREAKRQRLIGYNPADDARLPAAVREMIGADRVWTVDQLNAFLKGGVCRELSGARGRTRTCDLRFRRPTL